MCIRDSIVLDEPTSFLDIRYKLELLTVLKQLVREKQVAVILSLQDVYKRQVVVGTFAGSNAMAAVGSTTSLFNLLVNSFIGISVGANVLVARHYGERDRCV